MAFEKTLRDLVGKGGLRKVARDLGINHSSLYKSIKDGSNVGLDRVRAILNLFGYELKISKRKGVKEVKSRSSKKSETRR